jgi:hypothetical protein
VPVCTVSPLLCPCSIALPQQRINRGIPCRTIGSCLSFTQDYAVASSILCCIHATCYSSVSTPLQQSRHLPAPSIGSELEPWAHPPTCNWLRVQSTPTPADLYDELCPQRSSALRSVTKTTDRLCGAERASRSGPAEPRSCTAPYKPQRIESAYQSPTLPPLLSSGSMAKVRYQTVLQS